MRDDQEYSPGLFPYDVAFRGKILRIHMEEIYCPVCTTAMLDTRGFAFDHSHAPTPLVEFETISFCPQCDADIPLKIRCYLEEDRTVWLHDGKWTENRFIPLWLARLRALFRRLFRFR